METALFFFALGIEEKEFNARSDRRFAGEPTSSADFGLTSMMEINVPGIIDFKLMTNRIPKNNERSVTNTKRQKKRSHNDSWSAQALQGIST